MKRDGFIDPSIPSLFNLLRDGESRIERKQQGLIAVIQLGPGCGKSSPASE